MSRCVSRERTCDGVVNSDTMSPPALSHGLQSRIPHQTLIVCVCQDEHVRVHVDERQKSKTLNLCLFIITDKEKDRRGGGRRCRCHER